MNRQEALHILGLNLNATTHDVKVAYRELAQIMHPDRFAHNERLARRTAEQFKLITQAKELLLDQMSDTADFNESSTSTHNQSVRLQALHVSIEALRIQLDGVYDMRKRGLGFLAIGVLICAIFRANPISIAGSLLIIHGGFEVFRSVTEARALQQHLVQLRAERDSLQ